MTPDLALIAGTSACGGVAISMITQWRQRRKSGREATSVREALELRRTECSEQFEELKKAHQTLEESLHSTRDVLRDGRLNRSTRSAAVQLLRTGMSPDTAASTLGLARREMQMLAKVFVLLSANSADCGLKSAARTADLDNSRVNRRA
jgi:hypothetical protein